MVNYKRAQQLTTESSHFRAMKIGRALHRQSLTILIVLVLVVVGWNFNAALVGLNEKQVAISILIGLLAGLVVAFMRESWRDTAAGFTSIEKRVGLPVMGAAPMLTTRDFRDLSPDMRTPFGCLVHKPASDFARAFRQLQDIVMRHRVVSFIGASPDDGATTTALCTAASAQMQGYRTIIVDCDLRRRSLSRELSAIAGDGVLQAARRPEAWREAVQEEPETGLHFIPAAPLQSPWQSLLDAQGFAALIRMLRDNYDLVVLDCPPAFTAADGPIMASAAQACVAVMGWDATPMRTLRAMQRRLPRHAKGIAGLYVNRAPGPLRFLRPRSNPPRFAFATQ